MVTRHPHPDPAFGVRYGTPHWVAYDVSATPTNDFVRVAERAPCIVRPASHSAARGPKREVCTQANDLAVRR